MSLEDLMNIDVEVTSVSKTAEKGREAAAAVFVITHEDIRRSGATSIPELLRTVPGLSVARLDANKWAITSRGFNDQFANKLLVLIDGRTVYTSLFAGVFWEIQDLPLEDIDRIEVIRGPGGTLWGANAVNGVINIITKSAKDTQGGLLTAGYGTEEQGFGTVRYGGAFSDNTHYRIHLKYFDRDDAKLATGDDAADNWTGGNTGFRIDSKLTDEDSLTVLGGFYDNRDGQTYVLPSLIPPFKRQRDAHTDFVGGNMLARWHRQIGDTQDFDLQVYLARDKNSDLTSDLDQDACDINFQHHIEAGSHNVLWGLGYRRVAHGTENTIYLGMNPEERNEDLFSAFIQDQWTFLDDRLVLTYGSKFEHNDYTGVEVQPNVRLAWTPDDRQTLWAAVSRAVRVPSRGESDIRIDSQALPFVLLASIGNPDMKAEDLLSEEVGYRIALNPQLAFDVAVFHNNYNDLRTLDLARPFFEAWPLPPHLVVPVTSGNHSDAESYGVELAADWQALSWWQWSATYSYIEIDLDLHSPTVDLTSEESSGATPQHQATLQSHIDLRKNVEWDTLLRYVGELETLGVGDYWGLDVRLGWRPTDSLELSVVGQNLTESRHPEFAPSFVNTVQTEMQRSVYGEVTWRF
jgi:iron complex outermembrane receptor protein